MRRAARRTATRLEATGAGRLVRFGRGPTGAGASWFAVVLAILAGPSVTGCGVLTVRGPASPAWSDSPASRESSLGLTEDGSDAVVRGPRVLEAALLGHHDVVLRAEAEAPAALKERLAVLAAVLDPSRERRLERLEALADESDDPLVAKTAARVLEQDDGWQAASIDAERFETFWSGFADGVLRTVGAAVQGNPFGVVRPLVEGVDGLLRPDEIDALHRRQLALSRRWLLEHPDGTGLPDGADEVRARTEELRAAVFEQELRLIDRALEEERLGDAAAHLHVASSRRPHDEAVRARALAWEEAEERRRGRRAVALAVDPAEVDLRLAEPAGFEACRRLTESVLRGEAAGDACAELAATAASEGWPDVARSLERAALAWTPEDPWKEVREAEDLVAARRRAFVWTGARPNDDRTARYRQAADPPRFRATDVFTPLFWVPATLARSLSLAFGRPIDDRPVVDALAAVQWRPVTDEERRRATLALVELHEERGEVLRAYALARAARLPEDRVAELEDGASEHAFRRADAIAAEGLRRASLAAVAERFEGRSGGRRARERLDLLEADAAERSPALPATALFPLAERLGVPAHLVDGRTANGEVEPPGFRLRGDRLTWDVLIEGERRSFERRLDEEMSAALDPLVEEWTWRRRATAARTFRESHAGVPVEFRAGLGLEGFSLLPRLLPEVDDSEDHHLFQP